MTAQLPPHDVDTEASCLNSIMMNREALLKVLHILNPEDFYLEQHRLVYEAITWLDRRNSPIDLITVKQYLVDNSAFERAGGDRFLAGIYRSTAISANAETYAKRIRELSLRRKLIEVSAKVVESCHDLSQETAEMLDEAERQVFDVTQGRVTSDITSMEEVVRETLETIDLLFTQKRPITGTATGFTDLDEMLTGFHPAELIILAARPSMGKTALALNFMNHMVLRENRCVFFFSLEMPAIQLLMRLICIESLVEAQRLRTGRFGAEELKRIHVTAENYAKSKAIIDDSPGVTIADIRAKCRRVAQKQELGAIIIDYLQLVTSHSRVDRHQQISEISRGLKLLARELRCPVLALSQLSRSVESRTEQIPQLSDLRESGAIEQDADVVMFIYREERVKKDSEKKGQAEVIVAKQRNGPIGSVDLKFWDMYMRFENLERIHSYDEAVPDVK